MTIGDEVLEKHKVRLFPSVRISSGREAEQRATAALLAVTQAVSDFGRVLVSLVGGPRGHLQCYTEVGFPEDSLSPKRNEIRPDGLIRVTRGRTDWRAFVEVKVGDNPLDQEQIDTYHKLAAREGVNALITISNQAALPNGLPPLAIDGRRLRSVGVTHLSWDRLLSEAQLLARAKAVEDPDQKWMLEEWIHYLVDPSSQVIEPPDLGGFWKDVLKAARQGNLQVASQQLYSVVEKWDAFERKLAMRLRAKLGVDVTPRLRRADRTDPQGRTKRLHTEAVSNGSLTAHFRVPDAAGDLSTTVLLLPRTVQYALTVKAPSEGRAKTRVNWLLRQLRSAPSTTGLVVKVQWDQMRSWSQAQASVAMDDPRSLFIDVSNRPIDPKINPRSFVVERTIALPRGRGRSTAPVLEGIASGLESFYRTVGESLRAYTPPVPRMPHDSPQQSAEPPDPAAGPKLMSADTIYREAGNSDGGGGDGAETDESGAGVLPTGE